MKLDKIYLTGFMTSGKSTIGPILSNVLGWNYFDLDEEIVKEQEKTIDEIFSHEGEKVFRRLESDKLIELSNESNCVIALGGGTIINESNLSFVKANGKLIYFKSSPDAIYSRIKNKLDRPLFKDLVLENRPKEEFIKRINDILEKREKYYSRADIIVPTNNRDIGPTVDLIANKISKMLDEKNKN